MLKTLARWMLPPTLYMERQETAVSTLDAQTPKFALERLKMPLGVQTGAQATEGIRPINLEALGMKLAFVCGVPISHWHIIERYKGIYLIEFTPCGSIDPIIPLPAYELGAVHDDAWRRLAEQLQAWDRRGNVREWFHWAKRYATIAGNEAVGRLPADEATYYILQMFRQIVRK